MISLVSLITYDIFTLLRFKKLFQLKRDHWIYFIIAIAINAIITAAAYILLDSRFAVYMVFVSFMISFRLLFSGTTTQTLYAGSIYLFSLYSSRGIVFSIYSIALHTSIKNVLQQHDDIISVLAVLLSIFYFLMIRDVIVPRQKARYLMNNQGQLKFVVIYLFFQWLFLTLINDGRYYDDVRQNWYSTLYMGSCIISNLWLLVILNHASRISELFEYELFTHQLQEQLSRQMRHYQSYRKFTESYRAFRHDYEKLMGSLKTLMRRQEYKKAIKLLDDIHDTMQRSVQIHKDYSDNIVLDAILQDAADVCEEKNIRFQAHAHLPESASMTELEIVRVFSNIINNAIEACNKVSEFERFIEVTSNSTQDWTIIEVTNSFNGELLIANGEPKTTKKDKDYHGFGLQIIRETIEGMGGLVFIEPDSEKGIFKIKSCIPINPRSKANETV
ncbi:sensor histidine kinase [Lacrimispora celerecrescens]|uniref:Histidine kinase n=1 Tax=Lacrimispora celerecrescens TaxID=29354 RepID=A0A084JPC1_9FIRM|nr:GHKL domain-containing protein [Lacrimispora celerecrescens]KEZ90805.1 histidine kinase [Lacrimispora celerecrescens]